MPGDSNGLQEKLTLTHWWVLRGPREVCGPPQALSLPLSCPRAAPCLPPSGILPCAPLLLVRVSSIMHRW